MSKGVSTALDKVDDRFGFDVRWYVAQDLADQIKALIVEALSNGGVSEIDFPRAFGMNDLLVFLQNLGECRMVLDRPLITIAALQGKRVVVSLENISAE